MKFSLDIQYRFIIDLAWLSCVITQAVLRTILVILI